jgi:mRNA-degrading endonuclease YafQ of YafQ-DinJ toxin-antitoxin module
MNWELIFTDTYQKREVRFLKRHPELRQPYYKTLQLLEANPFHSSLRLHPLKGKLKGLYSISINLSYRLTLEFLIQEHSLLLVNLGDHDTLY